MPMVNAASLRPEGREPPGRRDRPGCRRHTSGVTPEREAGARLSLSHVDRWRRDGQPRPDFGNAGKTTVFLPAGTKRSCGISAM